MNFKAIGVISILAAGTVLAQIQSGFEVASVKRSLSGQDKSIRPSGDSLSMHGMTLKDLITIAYEVREFQISGGPDWIDSDRYDIIAKAERKASWQQMMVPMLQNLLRDRYNLALHPETREGPIYVLGVSKNGVKLQLSKKDCTVVDESNPQFVPGKKPPTFCGALLAAPGGLNGVYVGAEYLARTLSFVLKRTVVDETGIDWKFDVHLSFAPVDAPAAVAVVPGEAPGVTNPSPAPDNQMPSIFTAIQDLGLRLESSRGPVKVLVIDHAERPDEN
jgi:uncharacterized protein (TIGR03435 family)